MKFNAEGRIPSLDGVRAVSIVCVVVSHLAFVLAPRQSSMAADSSMLDWVKHQVLAALLLGDLGVQMFFVLSGFLITLLLTEEVARTGTVNLGRFYVRRTLRIFPAYYAYLAVIIALVTIGAIDVPWSNLLASLTYTSNYCVGCGAGDRWYVAHSWSLAVEEQFYLLWPAALVLLGARRGVLGVGLVLVICPLLRGWYQWTTGDVNVGFRRFELVADSLATGCLLALLRVRLHSSSSYPRILASRGFVLVPVSVLLLTQLAKHPSIHSPFLFVLVWRTWMNVAIAMCIDWSMVHADGRIGRVLNQRTVARVGVLSYSIYLWHMPFLDPFGTLIVHRFPVNLVFIAAAAALSYYVVERPILRMRPSVERRVFDGRPVHHVPLNQLGQGS